MCTLHQYFSGHQSEKNETGEACSEQGGYDRCIEGFGGEM